MNEIPIFAKANGAPDLRRLAAARQAHDLQIRVLMAQLAAQIAGPLLAEAFSLEVGEKLSERERLGGEGPLELNLDPRPTVHLALSSAEYLLGALQLIPTPGLPGDAGVQAPGG